jgi:hypothetical protein
MHPSPSTIRFEQTAQKASFRRGFDDGLPDWGTRRTVRPGGLGGHRVIRRGAPRVITRLHSRARGRYDAPVRTQGTRKTKVADSERIGDITNTCYLCDGRIGPDDRVARAHELVIHHECYERDLERGRSPGNARR